MPLPDSAPPRHAPLTALVAAALGLSLVEFCYSLAERWYHAPAYYALSTGLTLALALPIALVAMAARLPPGAALAAWLGLCLGFGFGPAEGVAAGVLALVVMLLPFARRAPASVLGTLAGLALAAGYLKSPNFAEHLGHKDELVYESVGAVVVLVATLALMAGALVFAPARVGPRARVAVLLVLGCLFSQRPRLERGDGEHRRPPAAGPSTTAATSDDPRPNILVLVLDTVRADHMTLYGHERGTTPELAALVARRENARVYPRAFANGTWTVPSHASLFTGQLPNEHGAHFALDGSVRVGFGIRPSVPTLAELLKDSAYATVGGFANHWLRSVSGMNRGFDRFLRAPDVDELPFIGEDLRARFLPGLMPEVAKGCARAPAVNATLLSLVEPWSRGPKPLYAFANYVDAHGPYAPPPPFRGRFHATSLQERAEHLDLAQSRERIDEQRARYDEELAYLDHHLGELFRRLDELALLDETWVFITSDHGEAFGEHGVLEHGTTVHNEVTHIPLIVLPPRGQTLPATDQPVSLVDVARTIAGIAGVELDGPGRDLRTPEGAGTHPSVLEFYGDPVKAAKLGPLAKRPARAVVLGKHKLIAYADSFHLYDIEQDPLEQIDLARALPHLVEHMQALLPEFGTPTFRSDAEAPESGSLDALRGMGYVGGVD